jgi:hypothetical protein
VLVFAEGIAEVLNQIQLGTLQQKDNCKRRLDVTLLELAPLKSFLLIY